MLQMHRNGFNYSVSLIGMIDLENTKKFRIIKPTMSASSGTCNLFCPNQQFFCF